LPASVEQFDLPTHETEHYVLCLCRAPSIAKALEPETIRL